MITNEDKVLYILTQPELGSWSQEVWGEMWVEYIEWCSEVADLNDETVDAIMEDFDFLDWYKEWLEDQTAVTGMLKHRGIL